MTLSYTSVDELRMKLPASKKKFDFYWLSVHDALISGIWTVAVNDSATAFK